MTKIPWVWRVMMTTTHQRTALMKMARAFGVGIDSVGGRQ